MNKYLSDRVRLVGFVSMQKDYISPALLPTKIPSRARRRRAVPVEGPGADLAQVVGFT